MAFPPENAHAQGGCEGASQNPHSGSPTPRIVAVRTYEIRGLILGRKGGQHHGIA